MKSNRSHHNKEDPHQVDEGIQFNRHISLLKNSSTILSQSSIILSSSKKHSKTNQSQQSNR